MTTTERRQRGVNTGRKTYECIDRKVGIWLRAYYECALSDVERFGFEEHLSFCFYCQDRLDELDSQAKWIHGVLRGEETERKDDKRILETQVIASGCY